MDVYSHRIILFDLKIQNLPEEKTKINTDFTNEIMHHAN